MKLSDRMKTYEATSLALARLTPNLPVIARIDGKAFHSWTRGLLKPYDDRLQDLFDVVTRWLVLETAARIGYTQSDEVSLIFYNDQKPDSQIFLDGRIAKLTSILASMTTAVFNEFAPRLVEKGKPFAYFDCRVFTVPSEAEAANYLIWRELDATRNSIQMAAQAYFSPKQLNGKKSEHLHDMLMDREINWNDYPARFKRGAYFRRVVENRTFMPHEIAALPEKHAARRVPSLTFARTNVRQIDMPPILRVVNREKVIFYGHAPITGDPLYEQDRHPEKDPEYAYP